MRKRMREERKNRACRVGVAWPGLLLVGMLGVAALQPVAAQSAPAPDAPNSPTAVAPADRPPQDPRIVIGNETQTTQPTPNAGRKMLGGSAPGAATAGGNRRLILTDGSYQTVRSYQIAGDRVRYFSVDREDWEELPATMVDWKATLAWKPGPAADLNSEGMQEAAELDREEGAKRAAIDAEMPEIVPGLRLPDRDGVFALDHYRSRPELVELPAVSGTLNSTKTDLLRALVPSVVPTMVPAMKPVTGMRQTIEVAGAAAPTALHDRQPQFYLSLEDRPTAAAADAVVVKTSQAAAQNNAPGAASAHAGFAIVRVEVRHAARLVGTVRVGKDGKPAASEHTVPVTTTEMPGGQWLRLEPLSALPPGEYALVQLKDHGQMSPEQMSEQLWDFSIRPDAPESQKAQVPLERQP